VVSIRSDNLAQLQDESRLREVPRLLFELSRLSAGAFRGVIEGPGRVAKPPMAIEPALTDKLIADLGGPDALPLLAFTLERLVIEYGHDGKLELDEYERDLGGVQGAIEQAVESAFAACLADSDFVWTRTELETLARRAFIPWLLRLDGTSGAPKRRIATLRDLPAEVLPFVRRLVDQRLLVSNVRGVETTIEVSHEAVLRQWGVMKDWIRVSIVGSQSGHSL
jgi:hypothetical protein